MSDIYAGKYRLKRKGMGKFKGKWFNHARKTKYLYGNLIVNHAQNGDYCYIIPEEKQERLLYMSAKGLLKDELHWHYRVHPKSVKEYTGIDERDYGKRRIYESDVVKCHVEMIGFPLHWDEITGVVRMLEGQWFVDTGQEGIPLWEETGYHWEIINNADDIQKDEKKVI